MKISIIIPCYNVEEYIDRCVESLFRQEKSIEKEIILVNDGSTDKTLGRLQEIEESHPEEVMLIPLSENCGQSVARNVAMSYSTGDYFFFLDADDWIEDNTFFYFVRLIENYENVDIIMSDSDRPNDLSDITSSPEENHIVYDMHDDSGRQSFLKQRRLEIGIGGKLISKRLFQNYDIQFIDGYKYEDNYVCFLLFEKAKKIVVSNQILYHWYMNPYSTTSTKKNSFDKIYVQELLLERLKNEPEYNIDREIIEYNFWEKAFVETVYGMGMHDGCENVEIVRMLKEFVAKRVPHLNDNEYINHFDRIMHFFGVKYFWELYRLEEINVEDIINLWKKFAISFEKGCE